MAEELAREQKLQALKDENLRLERRLAVMVHNHQTKTFTYSKKFKFNF